jgi:tRNA G46 methylase TrmB
LRSIIDEDNTDFDFSGYDIEVYEQHPRVLETALKHCRTWDTFEKSVVIAKHTYVAFQEAKLFVDRFYSKHQPSTPSQDLNHDFTKYVILDSGCGVGLSSVTLAHKYPNLPIIAIDRSFVRLSKNKFSNYSSHSSSFTASTSTSSATEEEVEEVPNTNLLGPTNLFMVRAELADFWYLVCHFSDWCVKEHYILYPNPYPKNKHLRRRWHGK